MVDCCGFQVGFRFFSAFLGFLFSQQSAIFPMDLGAYCLPWSPLFFSFYHSLVTTTLATMFCFGLVWIFLLLLGYCYLLFGASMLSTMVAMEFMAPTPGPFVGFLLSFHLNEMVLEWWLGHFSLALSTWDLVFAGVYPFWFLCGSHHYLDGFGSSLPSSNALFEPFSCLSISPRWWIDGLVYFFFQFHWPPPFSHLACTWYTFGPFAMGWGIFCLNHFWLTSQLSLPSK